MSPELHDAITEPARLDELFRLRLLDTPPEEPFDRLTRLAARIFGASVALVSLVDDRRQFFKSAFGLPEPWATLRETPLSHSFCKHVVATAAPLVINDAREHPLMRDNPAVSGLGVIAYLGVPLTTQNGRTLGSFCVIAPRPVAWSIQDQTTLAELAASVMSEIALRYTHDGLLVANASMVAEAAARHDAMLDLQHSEARLRTAQRLARVGSFELRIGQARATRCSDCAGDSRVPRLPAGHWSDEAQRIMGLGAATPPSSVDEFVAHLVHPDDRCRVAAAVADATTQQRTIEIEYRIRRPNGDIRSLLTAIEIEKDIDGAAGAMCTALDVTERHAAEAAVAEYRNELWHVARVATAGEMATVVAHEINQPLAAIAYTANACARLNACGTIEQNELAGHLDTISAQARRAGNIIRQLRSFVRKQPPTQAPIDLDRVVDDILAMLSAISRSLGVEIVRRRSAAAPRVVGDEIQLGQLVLNLLRNAFDAVEINPATDRRVEIVTSFLNRRQVQIEIADNGPGIGDDLKTRIFEPFFTTRTDGLGMGLPISQTIAEAHGGTLSVSDRGRRKRGAKFRAVFPAIHK